MTTENFLRGVNRSRFSKKSILLKGGRRFQFERIGRILEDKIHTTVLEVNLDHMIHNLNYFRSLLREGEQVMAMVKASGYGNGTFEVANMLEQQGVGFLAVAFADEGVALREAGITMPIVVLNADSDSSTTGSNRRFTADRRCSRSPKRYAGTEKPTIRSTSSSTPACTASDSNGRTSTR